MVPSLEGWPTKAKEARYIHEFCTVSLKLVSAIFYQIFDFPLNDYPRKTMKSVFYFIKKVLFVLEIFKLL